MARTDPGFMLRMPAVLKDELTRSSKRNGRSLNGEIVARLIASVEGGDLAHGLVESLQVIGGKVIGIAAILSDPAIQGALRQHPLLAHLATPTREERAAREVPPGFDDADGEEDGSEFAGAQSPLPFADRPDGE